MKKELSLETMNRMMSNRVKAKDLLDGEQVLTFENGALTLGTVVRCDECLNVSLINAGTVDARTTPESSLHTLKFCLSSKLLEADSIGCFDDDVSGDVLCPECTAKRMAGAQ